LSSRFMSRESDESEICPNVEEAIIARRGNVEGETLVYHGEFDYLRKHVSLRSETRPIPGGGFTLTGFASVNGGPEQLLLVGRAEKKK
jgi:hypothetical protein